MKLMGINFQDEKLDEFDEQLEMLCRIEFVSQRKIERFLSLISRANELQEELSEVFIEALEIQKEFYNGNTRQGKIMEHMPLPMFEMTTPSGEILLVDNLQIVTTGSILSFCQEGHGYEEILPWDIDAFKKLEEIKVSARQICPPHIGRRRQMACLCKKTWEECDKCICSEHGGWNWKGYDVNKVQFRQLGIKM